MISFKLLWIIIVLLYIICPNEYSRIYCICNFIIFILFSFQYFKAKKKDNYWDFDTLFLLVFTITSYSYPVFIYNDLYPFLPFFNNGFNVDNISKGCIASTIAGCLYMQGSLSKQKTTLNTNTNIFNVSSHYIIILAAFFCIFHVVCGGLDYYKNMYNDSATKIENPLILQLQILALTSIMCALGIELYNYCKISKSGNISAFKLFLTVLKRKNFINRTLLLIAFLWAIALSIVGNRTNGIAILIAIIYVLSYNHYKIGLNKFLIITSIGFLFMFSIQITRAGNDFDITNLAFNNVISDFIIPSRGNYLVFEAIEDKGISYGMTTLSPLISVIPSLDSFLDSMEINFPSSPAFFTNYTKDMGMIVRTGLGTTLQADVMLSFGWLGLILFYFLGQFTAIVYEKMRQGHFYSYIIYLCLISMSVYWVRAEYTYPARLIIWSVIMSHFCKSFNLKLQNK